MENYQHENHHILRLDKVQILLNNEENYYYPSSIYAWLDNCFKYRSDS